MQKVLEMLTAASEKNQALLEKINAFMQEGKPKKMIAVVLCLVLLCTLAGCGKPAPSETAGAFTLEDLERCNAADVIFAKYNSLGVESKFYDIDLPDGSRGDFSQRTVYIKGSDGVSLYSDVSYGYAYSVGSGNAYQNDQGEYSTVAFFDDGCYEEYYLPLTTSKVAYSLIDGEELISSTVEGGIRTLITQVNISDAKEYAEWGITEGIFESLIKADAESGLFIHGFGYSVTDGGERKLLFETALSYGGNDDYPLPEYVTACMDLTKARTVSFVRDPGTAEEKTFTFTLPKDVALIPMPMEAYEYYTDAGCTVPHEQSEGEYPDELTLYMKRAN